MERKYTFRQKWRGSTSWRSSNGEEEFNFAFTKHMEQK
jgi:hypothetical protein